MVSAERLAILKIGGVASAVMIVLSLLLADTIAGPVRRLADSAERVRRRIRTRVEIPNLTRRRDEIGHLSGALRDMTDALYNRMRGDRDVRRRCLPRTEESADLLALRGRDAAACAAAKAAAPRLLAVIEHDVKRLDRLISDISDASRLDAELQRQDVTRGRPATAAVGADDRRATKPASVMMRGRRPFRGTKSLRYVLGARSRLAIRPGDFQPLGQRPVVLHRRRQGTDRLSAPAVGHRHRRRRRWAGNSRGRAGAESSSGFYTDRPHQGFGQNSGLGLSISKQIIEAHGGRIWAENRAGPLNADGEATVAGARFVVRLPAP